MFPSMDSDERCSPTCYRHDQMVERMATVEAAIQDIRRSIEEIRDTEKRFEEWKQAHSKQAQWFIDHEPMLRQIVSASNWAITFRRFMAYLFGAILSVLMTWAWLKENFKQLTGWP